MKSDVSKRVREANRKICKEYPFLLIHSYNRDGSEKRISYSHIFLDDMPIGWQKAFGLKMCAELRQALRKADLLESYRVLQVKDKFGELQWNDLGGNEETDKIIAKYKKMSRITCAKCGKKATRISQGRILPYCSKCYGNTENETHVPIENGY